ncbi:MAG: CoA pyrophosphatase [Pseudomonadota bacterium]
MALSFDPQQLPVVGIDDHLPALTAEVLRSASVRQRFLMPPLWTPEIKQEPRFNDRSPTHASVLVALVERDELTVLLTQRTDHLNDHPGQVSFAGGRVEPTDADAAATALREAQEEIGLHARFVDVLGAMPTYTTGTGFIVTPIVALVRPGFTVAADPFEVAEVFEVPLRFLMDPANHRRHAIDMNGAQREFLSMPYDGVDAQGQAKRYFIWGATAAMLRNLYRFLAA